MLFSVFSAPCYLVGRLSKPRARICDGEVNAAYFGRCEMRGKGKTMKCQRLIEPAIAHQLEMAFNAAGDAICLLDRKGKIFQCNSAMEKLLEKPASEITGHACWELIHGTSEPIEGCPVKHMSETLRSEALTLPVGDRWFNVIAAPILDEAGNLSEAIHILADITERKQMEQALRDSEEKFHKAFDTSPDSITITSVADGKIIECNEASSRLTGYTREELIGYSTVELNLWADTKDRECYISMLLEKGRVIDMEAGFRIKTGEIRAGLVCGEFIELAGKQYILGTIRDITEHKRAEERISTLLRFQNEMLDTAAIWIDTLDEKGNVTFWNRAAEQISGYTGEEVLGYSKIWEWLYPDADYREEILGKAMAIMQRDERVMNFETTICCKDGKQRVISWHSNNLKNEDGQIVGSLALGADITERRKAEEALRTSEKQHRIFAELTSDYVYVFRIDPTGQPVLEWISEAFERMTGYTAEELRAQPAPFENIHPDDRLAVAENHRRVMEGETTVIETRIVAKHGEV